MRITNKRKQRISDKLKKRFSPTFIEIIDNSLAHSGHGGFDNSAKETHLFIKIILYYTITLSCILYTSRNYKVNYNLYKTFKEENK